MPKESQLASTSALLAPCLRSALDAAFASRILLPSFMAHSRSWLGSMGSGPRSSGPLGLPTTAFSSFLARPPTTGACLIADHLYWARFSFSERPEPVMEVWVRLL